MLSCHPPGLPLHLQQLHAVPCHPGRCHAGCADALQGGTARGALTNSRVPTHATCDWPAVPPWVAMHAVIGCLSCMSTCFPGTCNIRIVSLPTSRAAMQLPQPAVSAGHARPLVAPARLQRLSTPGWVAHHGGMLHAFTHGVFVLSRQMPHFVPPDREECAFAGCLSAGCDRHTQAAMCGPACSQGGAGAAASAALSMTGLPLEALHSMMLFVYRSLWDILLPHRDQ